jgi:hypothetical protein
MTKIKMLALTMLAVWPFAMLYGYQFGGLLHIAVAGALVMWMLEVNPLDPPGARRRSPPRRQG